VSQPLLGVEQDSASVEWLTLPPRLAKDPWAAMDLAKAPASFVAGPAPLPVAKTQTSQRQVVLRAGMRGIAFDGTVVRLQCLFHAAHIEQGVAPVGGGGAAAQSLSPLEELDGL